MKSLALVLAAIVLFTTVAMVWQHLRYLHTRRDLVQDLQPLLYGSSAFHVVTFLRTAPEADVIEAVRKLRAATEGPDVRWVYAGKVALPATSSAQMGEVDWSAIILLQYTSRQAYEEASRTESYRQALASFPETYSHGFERPVALNLMLPQFLLAQRVRQLLRREPSHFPFQRAEGIDANPFIGFAIERLLAEAELGAVAAVVVNLQKHGTPEQRAADSGYGGRMMRAMAEGGYGPMHMGPAVAVESEHDFDTVVIVYYPGVQFFADMLRSAFFQGIIGGKQLGDNQSTITVPILECL